ncbi:MAG: hypothetical protein ABR543_18300 [Gemmatimonadaceae bacterium]
MSANEVDRPPKHRRETQRYGSIIVIGGGCYGSYYVRQLLRAARAGAIAYERLLVVDRDPTCAVATATRDGKVTVVTEPWSEFLGKYLASAASEPHNCCQDAIVPSPLMPHVMFDWLRDRARERWPSRSIEMRPVSRAPSMPWQHAHPDGTHYVSFAEWMCPINCIEPANCPEIRGPRTWSMPQAVRAYVDAENSREGRLAGPVIFHCRHRAWGVGMFDTADVLAGDRAVAFAVAKGAEPEGSRVDLLVATVSHCHGALSILSVGPSEQP